MKTIAVIFGGKSTEHDVSVVTAVGSVIKPLRLLDGYKVIPVYISKQGVWYYSEKFSDISTYSSGEIDDLLAKLIPVQIDIGAGLSLVIPKKGISRTEKVRVDVVFPALHGTNGEDGALMGLLEMADVPYVGCSLPASVLAMDKVLAKKVTSSAGIPSTPWVAATKEEIQTDIDKVVQNCEKLRYPLFVKPPHLGSSIGITRATNEQELRNGLELAVYFDNGVIIEQGVQDLIEVTLPIMGNASPRPGLLEQPLLKAEDFFDFDTKYMNGGKKGGKSGGKAGAQGYSKLPADLPRPLYDAAVSLGVDVYRALGCTGIARIDMLIDGGTKEVFFNEVNPMPGDLYAHNWRAAGVASVDLVAELIHLAEDRWQSRQTQTTFSTNYLKQF